jgi:integrase
MATHRRRPKRQRGSGSIQVRGHRIYVRVSYTDPVTRERSETVERVRDREHADQRLIELLAERQETGGQSVQHSRRTFADLVPRFERLHLVEAQYAKHRNGKVEKTDGLREATLKNMRSILRMLKRELGTIELRNINPNFLTQFRRDRINAPATCRRCTAKAKHPKEHAHDPAPKKRSMTAVHRELSLLNSMLSVAVRDGWIRSNPFASFPRGKSLIQARKYESPRERVMTDDEETRILAACGIGLEGRRCHAAIIAIVETGMRRGELFKLLWSDVDLAADRITIQAMNNKTLKGRILTISARLHDELIAWGELYKPTGGGGPLLGSTGNIKRYWAEAKKKAAVSDLHLHDLRHTLATRLDAAGVKESAVSKVLGHARVSMTRAYINPDPDEILATVRAALDATNAANAANRLSVN